MYSGGIAFSSHPSYENSRKFNSSLLNEKKPLKETSPVFSTIYVKKKNNFSLEPFSLEQFSLEKDTDRLEHAHALAMVRFHKGTNDDWSIGWKRGWNEGFKYGLEKGQKKMRKTT